MIARFERLFGDGVTGQPIRIRPLGGEPPRPSLRVRHIEVDPGVRRTKVEFEDVAFDGDGLVLVVIRRERVVRLERPTGKEQNANDDRIAHAGIMNLSLVFEQIRAGGDRNFGYLLGDRTAGQAVLIDPSYSPDAFVERAREQGLAVSHVINTHSHPDHTNGNERAMGLTGAPLAAHPALRPAVPLNDGAPLIVGNLRLRCLHVPGHCSDHLALYEETHRLLVTGDLLFVGKVGGTSNDADARTEWNSLQRLVREIPDEATVWPGHDYGVRPSSTMALEKATNPFLLCANVEAFLQLKSSWATFKKDHGLK